MNRRIRHPTANPDVLSGLNDKLTSLFSQTKGRTEGERVDAIVNTLIPKKRDDSAKKILYIVEECVKHGLIKPSTQSMLFDEISQRYRLFNSTNSTQNVQQLAEAVKSSKLQEGEHDNKLVKEISNSTLIEDFFKSLPASADGNTGKVNFLAFKNGLKSLVVNFGNVATVNKQGDVYYLYIQKDHTIKINLNRCFSVLQNLWDITVQGNEAAIPPADALLDSQTRLLMQYVAAVTQTHVYVHGSYVHFKMNIFHNYNNTDIQPDIQLELENLADDYRTYGIDNIEVPDFIDVPAHQREMPLNRQSAIMTEEMMNIVRHVQRVFVTSSHEEDETPAQLVENVFSNLPEEYVVNYPGFINMLHHMLSRLGESNPDQLISIMTDNSWTPPAAMFEYDSWNYVRAMRSGDVARLMRPRQGMFNTDQGRNFWQNGVVGPFADGYHLNRLFEEDDDDNQPSTSASLPRVRSTMAVRDDPPGYEATRRMTMTPPTRTFTPRYSPPHTRSRTQSSADNVPGFMRETAASRRRRSDHSSQDQSGSGLKFKRHRNDDCFYGD